MRAAQGAASEVRRFRCLWSMASFGAASAQVGICVGCGRLGGAKAPARPAGRPGPCQGPRRGGVQGAAPLAHRQSPSDPLASRVIRALAECERAGSGPVQNELWVWLSIYGPRGDPQIPMLPSRSFAAAVVAWLGVGLVWFLKCESRNARRAKSVGQLDLGYAVRSRALPWAGSCLACFCRLYNKQCGVRPGPLAFRVICGG